MIPFRVTPEDRAQFRATLEVVQREVGSSGRLARMLIREVGDFDSKVMVAVFASEGTASGPKWRQLSPRYALRKARERPGRRILVYDGNLRRSFLGRGAFRIARVAGGVLELGSSHPLAIIHHEGSNERHNVRGYARRRMKPNQRALTKRGKLRMKGGVPVSARVNATGGLVDVRGHKRIANLPARPLIRRSQAQAKEYQLAVARIVLERLATEAPGAMGGQFRQQLLRLRRPNPRVS